MLDSLPCSFTSISFLTKSDGKRSYDLNRGDIYLSDTSFISGEALPFLAENNVMFSSSNFTLSGSNFKISIKKKKKKKFNLSIICAIERLPYYIINQPVYS